MGGSAAGLCPCRFGTMMGAWHFWQLNCFPAKSSFTEYFAPHLHLKSIAIGSHRCGWLGRENALWARAKTGCLTAGSIAESAFGMVAESGAALASSLHPQMGWWGCAIPPENRAMGGALGKVGRQPAWARRSRQRTALLNSDYPLRKVSEFRGLPFQKLNSTGEPQYGISASLSFDIR